MAPPDFVPAPEPQTAHLHQTTAEYLAALAARVQTDVTPEAAEFFLTARSRARETTRVNTPRMSLWPIAADPLKRTAFESGGV